MTPREQLVSRVAQMSEDEVVATRQMLDLRPKQMRVPSPGELLDGTRAKADLSGEEAEQVAAQLNQGATSGTNPAPPPA